jgi:hypothetical protein
MNGRASSGFNDVVVSFKWQLLVSYGFYSWPRLVASHFPSSASQAPSRSTKYSRRRKSLESRNSRLIGASCFARADTESPKV